MMILNRGGAPQRRRERGVNIIATVLMLLTIFLVMGFALGALSMMNLNLAGRSSNIVKANKLAEAAVAEFLYHVEEETYMANEEVAIDNPVIRDMRLNEYYDGTRQILGSLSTHMGEDCSVDVHFNKTGEYYSTDNINGEAKREGALGDVPPWTIDLIITVNLANFTKHYEVFINRKWEFAIFIEKAPVFLISKLNTLDGKFATPSCEINGNILSLFEPKALNPSADPLIDVDSYGYIKIMGVVPDRLYPASVFLGGEFYQAVPGESPTPSHTFFCYSEENKWTGKGIFGYPNPATPSPNADIMVYRNNVKSNNMNRYNFRLGSPFKSISPVNLDGVVLKINEVSCAGSIYKVEDYIGIHKDEPASPDPTIREIRHWQNEPPDPEQQAIVDDLYNQYDTLARDYSESTETIFFLARSLSPYLGSSPRYQWGESAKFIVQEADSPERYLRLSDSYLKASAQLKKEFDVSRQTLFDPSTGRNRLLVTDRYTLINSREEYGIDPDNNDFMLNNCALISYSDVELKNTDVSGDNCLLQVGDFDDVNSTGLLSMNSGEISAGVDIGMIIFCKNLYCTTRGTINGNIFSTNSVRIGSLSGSDSLEVNGAIAIQGNGAGGLDLQSYGGLVASGFKVNYKPEYNKFLNRFGPFRVAGWRDLD